MSTAASAAPAPPSITVLANAVDRLATEVAQVNAVQTEVLDRMKRTETRLVKLLMASGLSKDGLKGTV